MEKEDKKYKPIELRSEEVQEIMNKVFMDIEKRNYIAVFDCNYAIDRKLVL
jgi:hypothetical protein